MKRTIIPIILVIPLMALSVFLDAMSAQASPQDTTFTVNSTVDATDINPGDGICETAAGNGVCTLRSAVQEANALTGTDTIILSSNTYTLTIPGQDENESNTGDLDIYDNTFIIGSGPENTLIDGGNLDRVIHIVGTEYISTTFRDLTIQNGILDPSSLTGIGGGLYAQNGMVTINNPQ